MIEAIIDDDRVRAVTLTGSEPAGREVGARAGPERQDERPRARRQRPVHRHALGRPRRHRRPPPSPRATLNNGQSCIAAKRFIVHEQIADEFQRLLVEKMEALKVGDPMAEDTDLGPMSRPQGVEDLDKQVQDSRGRGRQAPHRRQAAGRPRATSTRRRCSPTSRRSAPPYYEELFGPVALFFRAKDLDEAIAIANDSSFGLGGSAWTQDADEAERFVDEVETGMVYINKVTASTPEVPFGGAKNSGYGRELASFGTQTFTNAKTVWIQ